MQHTHVFFGQLVGREMPVRLKGLPRVLFNV